MKAQIIKIGNSKGIRLPKSVIEQCELEDEVEIKVKDKKIVLSSSTKPRSGWAAELKKLTNNGTLKDKTVFDIIEGDFDEKEWVW